MARIFRLESGVQTTTEATKNFFAEVKCFTIALNNINNTVLFSSLDGTRKLRTTSVQNRAEINDLLAKNGGKYVRIQTRNSTINVWSDTPNC